MIGNMDGQVPFDDVIKFLLSLTIQSMPAILQISGRPSMPYLYYFQMTVIQILCCLQLGAQIIFCFTLSHMLL
jgi:hypothetical protein